MCPSFAHRWHARRRIIRVCVALALSLFSFWRGHAAIASSPDDARITLRGAIDQRERLRSGVVRIHGRRVKALQDGAPFESDVKIRYEFDFHASLLRIDWDEPVRELLLEGDAKGAADKFKESMKSGQMKTDARVSKYVHTPQYSLYWMSNNERVINQRAPEAKQYLHLQRFDIRALGFMGVYDFDNGTGFDEVSQYLTEQKIVAFDTTNVPGNGSVDRITWLYGPSEVLKREVFIDREHGYTPLHFAIRQRLELGVDAWEESPIESIDVTWSKNSDVWVPLTYAQRRVRDKNVVAELNLSFDWDSVNSPLDPKDFTYQELHPTVKAQVVSDQLGKQVLVGYSYPKGQTPLLDMSRSQSTMSSWRAWLLYGNILVITVILLLLLRRRLRTTTE